MTTNLNFESGNSFQLFKKKKVNMFYSILSDLLPVQNGVDFHVAGVGVHTKYVVRHLVDAGS